MWSSKTVTILQTPLDHYPFALTPPSSHSRPSTPKKARDKTTTFAIAFDITPHPSQTADYLFTMGNDSDIILSLEDSIIHLKLLLVSPHLGSLKGKAESLLVTLRQLRELFTLMADCQQKVCTPLIIILVQCSVFSIAECVKGERALVYIIIALCCLFVCLSVKFAYLVPIIRIGVDMHCCGYRLC